MLVRSVIAVGHSQWILLGISVVHLIVLGLLWSVAIAIVCSLPKVGKVTPISE
jgi:hypothetical protein